MEYYAQDQITELVYAENVSALRDGQAMLAIVERPTTRVFHQVKIVRALLSKFKQKFEVLFTAFSILRGRRNMFREGSLRVRSL